MIRVLHVYPEMRSAGTEMVIMNLLRNIDRDEVAFDFLVQREGESDERLRALGANIHYLPRTKKYYSELKSFFSEHPEYRIVLTNSVQQLKHLVLLRSLRLNDLTVKLTNSVQQLKHLVRLQLLRLNDLTVKI